jgi:hypothetical protein
MEKDDTLKLLIQISDKLDTILETLEQIASNTGKIMLDMGEPPRSP